MKTSTLLLTLFLLAGCVTSSKMPAKKVEQLKPNEGRVIGSVLLTVPTEKDPSSWAWLQGRKAESFTYELSIQARSRLPNPFAKTYLVVAKIGKEEHFVMKLPAGEYEFKEMRQGSVQQGAGANRLGAGVLWFVHILLCRAGGSAWSFGGEHTSQVALSCRGIF